MRRSNSLYKLAQFKPLNENQALKLKLKVLDFKRQGILQQLVSGVVKKQAQLRLGSAQKGAEKQQPRQGQKALTTGYQTSEGTQSSAPQSPQKTKYQDYAQATYAFEMNNLHHKHQSVLPSQAKVLKKTNVIPNKNRLNSALG